MQSKDRMNDYRDPTRMNDAMDSRSSAKRPLSVMRIIK